MLLVARPSLSTLHTAKPIEAGELEITVAPGLYRPSIDGTGLAQPQGELQLRYGINDDVDFGVKYSNFTTL